MANSRRLRLEYFEQRDLRAQALGDDGHAREEVARQNPELAGTITTICVAELIAAKDLCAEASRVRLMKLVRNGTGGWYRDRTCGPCRVKAMLYR